MLIKGLAPRKVVYLDGHSKEEFLRQLSDCNIGDWFQTIGEINTYGGVKLARTIASIALGRIKSYREFSEIEEEISTVKNTVEA